MTIISQPVGGAEIRQIGAPAASGAPSKKTAGAEFQNAPVSGVQNSATAVEPVGRAERSQRRDNDQAPDRDSSSKLSSSKTTAREASRARAEQVQIERADAAARDQAQIERAHETRRADDSRRAVEDTRHAVDTRQTDAAARDRAQVERADETRANDAANDTIARERADAARRSAQDRELRASQSEAPIQRGDAEAFGTARPERAAATQAAVSYARNGVSERQPDVRAPDRRVDLSV